MTTKSSSIFLMRKTYDIFLYNGIISLAISSGVIYLLNLETVSDILDHPVSSFTQFVVSTNFRSEAAIVSEKSTVFTFSHRKA